MRGGEHHNSPEETSGDSIIVRFGNVECAFETAVNAVIWHDWIWTCVESNQHVCHSFACCNLHRHETAARFLNTISTRTTAPRQHGRCDNCPNNGRKRKSLTRQNTRRDVSPERISEVVCRNDAAACATIARKRIQNDSSNAEQGSQESCNINCNRLQGPSRSTKLIQTCFRSKHGQIKS